jgi:hypothetical protein
VHDLVLAPAECPGLAVTVPNLDVAAWVEVERVRVEPDDEMGLAIDAHGVLRLDDPPILTFMFRHDCQTKGHSMVGIAVVLAVDLEHPGEVNDLPVGGEAINHGCYWPAVQVSSSDMGRLPVEHFQGIFHSHLDECGVHSLHDGSPSKGFS